MAQSREPVLPELQSKTDYSHNHCNNFEYNAMNSCMSAMIVRSLLKFKINIYRYHIF